MNNALSIAMEVPAYAATGPLLGRCGRRAVMAAMLAQGGLCLLLLGALSIGGSGGGNGSGGGDDGGGGGGGGMPLEQLLAFVAKLGITLAFSTVYVWGAELFPTDVRALSFGFCNLFARGGGMLAPVMAACAGAHAIFAALALLGCAVSLRLVETKGVDLPAKLYAYDSGGGGDGACPRAARRAEVELVGPQREDARVRDALLGR